MDRSIFSHITSISAAISLCLLLLTACGSPGKPRGTGNELTDKATSYWNGVDVAHLSADSLEQKIVDYLYIIGHLDPPSRQGAWPGFFASVEDQPCRVVVDYLGEPDSPLYAPAMLEEYLVALTDHTSDTTVKLRAEYLLENIRKCSEGSAIPDLNVIGQDRNTSLRQLITTAEQDCLVIFYDPDCDSCDALFRHLDNHPPSGLTIIAVSVSDHTKQVNDSWLSVHTADAAELDANFYFPSLPTVYLVSHTTTILRKKT